MTTEDTLARWEADAKARYKKIWHYRHVEQVERILALIGLIRRKDIEITRANEQISFGNSTFVRSRLEAALALTVKGEE